MYYIVYIHNAALLYPFGDETGDLRSPRFDDGGAGEIPLIYGPLPYFGTLYDSVYVSTYIDKI